MEETFRAAPGEASYATLAHVINAACSPEHPVSRQQVYMWHTRGTRNARGEPFPEPARVTPSRRQGQPSAFFKTIDVLVWYEDGLAE